MSKFFNKDKLYKDYYKCIQLEKLIKNNGDSYIKVRLLNKSGIIDGYIWEMIDFYKDRIKEGSTYAIKSKKEIYNNNSILNIKHLNKVDGGRYNRYSYNKSNITVSTEKVFEYYYNEVINLILKYPNPIIKMISKFYLKNKKKLLSLELMRYKSVCIKHAEVLAKSYHKNINLDLCIVIILIDKIPNLDSLFYDIKKIDQKYYEIIELYRMNHKEFIKKHKYIVDLISYNFKKEKVFKTK